VIRWLGVLALALLTSVANAADGFDLARYRGKVVLLDFWTSWCEPCRHSVPWLNELQAQYADQGLVIIGVNLDRERAAAERFLAEVPAQFEIIYDPEGVLAQQYKVPGMPSSYVFDAEGRLVATHVGFRKSARDEREADLRRHLPKPAARAAR
jgi:cytochrome c biogenesis protein CcmG/thiol:disulfide interchange protein DsbE